MEEEKEPSPLSIIKAAAFDNQLAAYRRDRRIIKKSYKRMKNAIKKARSLNIPDDEISRYEITGKLNAAIEEYNSKDAQMYQQLLEDLGS